MRKRHVLARLLVAAGLGAAATMVAASPAAAAVPVCDWYANKSGVLVPSVYATNSEKCWMQRGHTGGGVKMLQKSIVVCYGDWLRSIGFPDRVDVDGNFGPITYSALRQVQRLEDGRNPWGVDVADDGIYGSTTLKVMFHATGNGTVCDRY